MTDIEQTYVVPEEGQLVWNTETSQWQEKEDVWDEASRTPQPNRNVYNLLLALQERSEYYENDNESTRLLQNLDDCA